MGRYAKFARYLNNDESVLNDPYEKLICAIFKRAILDYATLCELNKKSVSDKHDNNYGTDEIVSFFGSSYCEKLLKMFGIDPEVFLTGIENMIDEHWGATVC